MMTRLTFFLLLLSAGVFLPRQASAQLRNYVDANGWKQGVHDGRSGSIVFERTYRNDTLNGPFRKLTAEGVPEETGYYKDGKQDSTWTTFDTTGKVIAVRNYKNGVWIDRPVVAPKPLMEPKFIRQAEVHNDTSIINDSKLRVFKLYDSRDPKFPRMPNSYLGEVLVYREGTMKVRARSFVFSIRPDGVLMEEKPDTVRRKSSAEGAFSTNLIVTEKADGEIEISYLLRKNYFPLQVGRVEVEQKQMRCDDTGYNPVRITSAGKSVYFKDAGNVQLFEYDSDGNGKAEFYLVNYFTCMGWLQIYKITE